jgi:hypothetical protein
MLVHMLLAGYPNLDAHDPQGYVSGLGTIACMFPFVCVHNVVARGFSYPPTFYEFRQALDAENVRLTREHQLKNRWHERQAMLPEPPGMRPSLDELEQRCLDAGVDIRPGWRIRKEHPRCAVVETAEEVRERLGISQEQWDALPDQPQKIA